MSEAPAPRIENAPEMPRWLSVLMNSVLIGVALFGWSVALAVWASDGAVLSFEDEDVALAVLDAGVTLFAGLLAVAAALYAAAVAWKGVQQQIQQQARQTRLQALQAERDDVRHYHEHNNRALIYSVELVRSIMGTAETAQIRAQEVVLGYRQFTRGAFADVVTRIFTENLQVSLAGALTVEGELIYAEGDFLHRVRSAVGSVMVCVGVLREINPGWLVTPTADEFAKLCRQLRTLHDLCAAYSADGLRHTIQTEATFLDLLGRQIREHFNG